MCPNEKSQILKVRAPQEAKIIMIATFREVDRIKKKVKEVSGDMKIQPDTLVKWTIITKKMKDP